MRLPFFLQLPDEDMIKQITRLCSSFLSYLSLLHDLEIYTRSNSANQWEFSTQTNFNYILKHPISTYKCETTEPIWYCETFAAQPSYIVSQTQVTLLRFTRSSYKFEISKSTAIIKNYFEKVKCTKRMFLDNNSISLTKLKRSKVSQHIFLDLHCCKNTCFTLTSISKNQDKDNPRPSQKGHPIRVHRGPVNATFTD